MHILQYISSFLSSSLNTADTPCFVQGTEALSTRGRSRGQRKCQGQGQRLCAQIHEQIWLHLQKSLVSPAGGSLLMMGLGVIVMHPERLLVSTQIVH